MPDKRGITTAQEWSAAAEQQDGAQLRDAADAITRAAFEEMKRLGSFPPANIAAMVAAVTDHARISRESLASLKLCIAPALSMLRPRSVQPEPIQPEQIKRAASKFILNLLRDNPEFKRLVCDVVMEEIQNEVLMNHPISDSSQ